FNAYIEYIAPGDYSDDTQLALATARSIFPDGRCDVEYFSKTEMPLWLGYARGAGATVIAAAKALSRRSAVWNKNFFTIRRGGGVFSYETAGANGAAMRIAPIAMANPTDLPQLQREVWRNAVVTHGHPRAIVGALVYARAVAYVISTPSPSMAEFLDTLRTFVESIELPSDPDLEAWVTEWQRRSQDEFVSVLRATCDEMLRFVGLLTPQNKT